MCVNWHVTFESSCGLNTPVQFQATNVKATGSQNSLRFNRYFLWALVAINHTAKQFSRLVTSLLTVPPVNESSSGCMSTFGITWLILIVPYGLQCHPFVVSRYVFPWWPNEIEHLWLLHFISKVSEWSCNNTSLPPATPASRNGHVEVSYQDRFWFRHRNSVAILHIGAPSLNFSTSLPLHWILIREFLGNLIFFAISFLICKNVNERSSLSEILWGLKWGAFHLRSVQ